MSLMVPVFVFGVVCCFFRQDREEEEKEEEGYWPGTIILRGLEAEMRERRIKEDDMLRRSRAHRKRLVRYLPPDSPIVKDF